MKEKINTKNGVFTYEPMELFIGRKYLDPVVSKKNLLDFKSVMDQHNIHYGLWFGTLLGAIREKDFIKHDEDTDVFVLEEDRDKVLNALFDFEKIGLKIVRYEKELLSFVQDDDYIDIYFYHKFLNQRIGMANGVNPKYLEKTKNIKFLGTDFPVPVESEEALVKLYGDDWHIPKEGVKAGNGSIKENVKLFFVNTFPPFYRAFVKVKNNFKKSA